MLKGHDFRVVDIIKYCAGVSPFNFGILLIYTLLNALIPAYQTITLGMFIDTAIDIFNNRLGYNKIYLPAFLMMLSFIFINILPPLISVINMKLKNKLEVSLRNQLISKRLDLEYQHIENNETLELINRSYNDALHKFESMLQLVLNSIGIVVNIVSLLLIIVKYSYVVGGLILIISVPLLYKSMKLGKVVYEMNVDVKKIKRKSEYLSNVLTSREYANERKLFEFTPNIIRNYETLYENSYNIEKNSLIKMFVNLKLGSVFGLILALMTIILLLRSVYDHLIPVGIFIGLTNAVLNLVQTMSWDLSKVMLDYAESKSYLTDFSAFFNLSEKQDAVSLPIKNECFVFESLEFENVTFRYPGSERDVLQNCSFKMTGDKSYGFVGENGAGKTTIVKLITGMYENYTGRISINGVDIKEYSFGYLKSIVSVVFQDFSRYSGTIKENILNGNPVKKDSSLLNEVVSKVGLDNFLEHLPEGIDTYIGKIKKKSVDLSGGQWQRVAIARLLYADSTINILDEPTSSLDPIEESRVYELFKQVSDDSFTLYITHRLGVVKSLDQILVLSNGRIEEEGTHEELMDDGGLYYEMYSSQRQWYEDEEKECTKILT